MAGKTKKWTVCLVLHHLRSGKIKVVVSENENNPVTITGESLRIGLQTRIYFLGEMIGLESHHKIKITTEALKTGFQVSVSGIVGTLSNDDGGLYYGYRKVNFSLPSVMFSRSIKFDYVSGMV